MFEYLPLAVFAGLLVFAAWSDIRTMTIPNWVSIVMTVAFPAIALSLGIPLAQIGLHLLFGFAVLAVGFVLFQLKILGGGDAKLIAAAAVWTGFVGFLPFAVWTTLAGGILAFALLMARNYLGQNPFLPDFVNRLLKPQGGVPYGVAIAAGGLITLGALPFASLTLP